MLVFGQICVNFISCSWSENPIQTWLIGVPLSTCGTDKALCFTIIYAHLFMSWSVFITVGVFYSYLFMDVDMHVDFVYLDLWFFLCRLVVKVISVQYEQMHVSLQVCIMFIWIFELFSVIMCLLKAIVFNWCYSCFLWDTGGFQ